MPVMGKGSVTRSSYCRYTVVMGSCAMAEMRAASGASVGTVPSSDAASYGAVAQTTASKRRVPVGVSRRHAAPSRTSAVTRVPSTISAPRSPSHAMAGSGSSEERSKAGSSRSESARRAREGIAQHAGEDARIRPLAPAC